MNDKCCVCGHSDRFMRFSVVLGNPELYGKLFEGSFNFCEECEHHWTDELRMAYKKGLDEIVKRANQEHAELVAEISIKMRKQK